MTQNLHEIKITVSDTLYHWLLKEAQHRNQTVPTVVETMLKQQLPQVNLTQTETWQLCGAFTISEPAPEYTVGLNEAGQAITNYAEYVNDVLYQGK